MKEKKLTPKQKAFAREYVKDNNGKEMRFDVKGGTVEVNQNKVIILAE